MDRVRNDDIRDRLGIAPTEEKLVQHWLRWFGHVQRRLPEVPVHSGILKHDGNMRRDLKDWSIPRYLSLDSVRITGVSDPRGGGGE